MLAACAARRWLARNAAGVKLVRSCADVDPLACTALVPCLPALEDMRLCSDWRTTGDDLGCLLEALAWCPRLRALDLYVWVSGRHGAFPGASAFAKLTSLTKLSLAFGEDDPCTMAEVVGALVPLAGLAELSIDSLQPAVVPAALGQLKGLRALQLHNMSACVLEAGCLDLPVLESLDFEYCHFEGAHVLPSVTALQCLTCVVFLGGQASFLFDPELVQLPRLARLVLSQDYSFGDEVYGDAPARLFRLPADMGLLSLSLVDLDIGGLRLARFPHVLTQLVAP